MRLVIRIFRIALESLLIIAVRELLGSGHQLRGGGLQNRRREGQVKFWRREGQVKF